MREINIEKIMEEIREEIKGKYADEAIDFDEIKQDVEVKSAFDVAAFRGELYQANVSYNNPFYFEIGGGAKGFVKKAIRKMVAFLGVPIVESQNEYNAKVVRMFNQMNNYIDEQEEKIKSLEYVIEGLEEKIARLNKK